MFSSLRWPLALAFFLLVCCCLGFTESVVLREVRAAYLHSVEEQLLQDCGFIANLMRRHMDQVALTPQARKRITDEMARLSLQMSGRLCIVNWKGEVLEDSAGRRGQRVGHRSEVQLALQGQPATRVRGLGDEESQQSWESLADPAMFVAVPMLAQDRVTGAIYGSRSLASLQAMLVELRLRLYAVGALSLAVGLLLSLALARWLTSPLRSLAGGARRLSRGEMDVRIPVSTRDEVGELAYAFNQMAQSLQEHRESLLRFVSDASHELKTPVASLRSGVEALEGGALEDPQLRQKFFGFLHRDLDRMESLVSDLLELHRLDRSGLVLDLERVEFSQMAQGFGEEYAALVVEGPRPWEVRADPRRLRQILTNLLENAWRAVAEQEHPRVILRWGLEGIEVEDNGLGLEERDVEMVFERFYRVDRGRARSQGGTGLGLAISRGLARAMGGELLARSPGLGQGATFLLKLPVA
jgi:signal transduction histidine kinase